MNISLDVFCILISVILIVCLRGSEDRNDQLNRLFARMLTCNTIVLACDCAGWVLSGRAGLFVAPAMKTVHGVMFIFAYIVEVVFMDYLVSYLATKTPASRLSARMAYGIAAIAIGLVIVSQFTDFYYYIDSNNIYHRSQFFWLSYLLGGIIIFINLILLIKYRKNLTLRDKLALYPYILLPAVAMIAQMVTKDFMFLYISITLAFFLIYVNIQVERGRRLKESELELADLRVRIMLSQIQPHFLYNMLTTIRQLCEMDPKEAKTAITEFSLFLRTNMDSLTRKTLIPFANELDHVKNYLSLEHKRFRDKLHVEYHIDEQNFMIPPLTLQPIVENAVRYGVTKRDEGGTVVISAAKKETGWCVTVADDGVGFDPVQTREDGRSHIGMKNVNDRLKSMCGGSLHVTSVPGEGTVAVITIPMEVKR